MHRYRVILTHVLAFTLGCLSIVVLPPMLRKEADWLPAEIGERPAWPSVENVTSIDVDMYTWTDPNAFLKRYQLTATRQGPRRGLPEDHGLFQIMLQCVRESAPITTENLSYESMGKIELVLDDGRRLRVYTYRNQYLSVRTHGKQFCPMYDAETFERFMRRYGTVVPHPQGENMMDSRGPYR